MGKEWKNTNYNYTPIQEYLVHEQIALYVSLTIGFP